MILAATAIPILAIGTILAVRLVLIQTAVPTAVWLDEFAPLTGRAAAASTIAGAVSASTRMVDADVAGTLLAACGPNTAVGDCLTAGAYGLRAAPGSGELWLARAEALAAAGAFDERLVRALANSYAAAPREGWIAASRLPLALRVRAFLPAAMLDAIGEDVVSILANRELALPLLQAYIADPLLRDSSWEVIERYASFDQQERLIRWIRGEL